MVEIIWTKDSLKTLNYINLYYSELVGYQHSIDFVNKLMERVNFLIISPQIGKSIKINRKKYKYIIFSFYKIIYKAETYQDSIKLFILVIFDTRQNPEKLTEKLKNL